MPQLTSYNDLFVHNLVTVPQLRELLIARRDEPPFEPEVGFFLNGWTCVLTTELAAKKGITHAEMFSQPMAFGAVLAMLYYCGHLIPPVALEEWINEQTAAD